LPLIAQTQHGDKHKSKGSERRRNQSAAITCFRSLQCSKNDDYQVPFKFTCTLDKLTLKIDRPRLSPADIEKLKEATRNNRAAE
jgi:hypothetical protein